MATIWISYIRGGERNSNVEGRLISATTISLSGSTANASAAAPAGTTIARFETDTACFFTLGGAATSASHRLGANMFRYIEIGEGAVPAGISA